MVSNHMPKRGWLFHSSRAGDWQYVQSGHLNASRSACGLVITLDSAWAARFSSEVQYQVCPLPQLHHQRSKGNANGVVAVAMVKPPDWKCQFSKHDGWFNVQATWERDTIESDHVAIMVYSLFNHSTLMIYHDIFSLSILFGHLCMIYGRFICHFHLG